MPWEFTEYQVRPGIFYWSQNATDARNRVKLLREGALQAFAQAEKKLEHGKFREAEELLTHAVSSWPDNPRLSLALGSCIAFGRQDPERGMLWLHESLTAKDVPRHRLVRSRAYAALGMLDEALKDCEMAVSGEPQNGVFMSARGMLQERLGQYAEATQDYSLAIPLLKEAGLPTFDCHFNRGYCHRILGNIGEAINDMEMAGQLNPSCMAVKTCLGQLFMSSKRYRDALTCFSAVASQNRTTAHGASNLALAQYLMAVTEVETATGSSTTAADPDKVATQNKPVPLNRTTSHRQRQQSHVAASVHNANNSALAAAEAASQIAGSRIQVDLRALLDPDSAADHGELQLWDPASDWRAAGDSEDDEDEEDEESDESPPPASRGLLSKNASMKGGRTAAQAAGSEKHSGNEHPKQWLLSILQGHNSKVVVDDASKRQLLEQSLANLELAMPLYNASEGLDTGAMGSAGKTSAARAAAGPSSEGYPVYVGQAADIPEGILLMLTNALRVPGTSVAHDKEIEEGELLYNRGLVELSLGRLEAAEIDFKQALLSNPHHAHYPYYQAMVYARKGDYTSAIQSDRAALRLSSTYFPALYHLGLLLHLQQLNVEAVQRLDAALLIQARNWAVMEARGRVLQEIDRHADALLALNDALARVPATEPDIVRARLLYAMAQTAIALQMPDLMRSSLRQSRLHGQDWASVYNLQGLLAQRERKPARALKFMTQAVNLAPHEARYYYDRSQCYTDADDLRNAISDLVSASERLPHASAQLHFAHGTALWELGDRPGALQALEAAAALAESHSGGRLLPDEILSQGKKMMGSLAGAADSHLTAAMWHQLGVARGVAGRPTQAVQALLRAVAELPGHPAMTHELARVLQADNQHAAAVRTFTEVLELASKSDPKFRARAHFGRGLAFRCLKNYDEAAADFESAKNLDPDNAALRVNYRRQEVTHIMSI